MLYMLNVGENNCDIGQCFCYWIHPHSICLFVFYKIIIYYCIFKNTCVQHVQVVLYHLALCFLF